MEMRSTSRALDKIYKRRDRYEIPEWQRQQVWSRSKRQSLIDTILRGWKLPKFYLLKTSDEPEEFEVVDGQQRLLSIWEFFDDKLDLSTASAKKFKGKSYSDLPEAIQDSFDDYEIEFDVIEDATDAEVKEFFQRLQEGLPLTSSEKLNSIESKLRDYSAKLAKHSFFRSKVAVSDKRYGHFDVMAKVAAIEIDGLGVGLRYDDLRVVFESQAQFSAKSNIAKRLSETLDFLDKVFESQNQRLRNRTVVQSLITLAARVVASGQAAGTEERFLGFFNQFIDQLTQQIQLGLNATDRDYLDFQRTVNANVRSGPQIRQSILLRKLLLFDPSFADVFDAASISESGFNQRIRTDMQEIATLIGSINERYSSERGEDLFKPTSKTALAQISLGKAITSYEDYKNLIENLYFLFHEGVGSRLQGKRPECFQDVNLLRTQLQHDVDHGPAAAVRAKKKKMGEAFKKYSGVTSPGALSAERFVIVQANLLAGLRSTLTALTW